MKLYPPMKLKVFVDDITAFLEGRSKESPEIAEMVTRAMRMEMAEKGLKLSVPGKGERKERAKSLHPAVIWKRSFKLCGKRERESMLCKHCGNIRVLELRTRTKKFEANENARRRRRDVRFTIARRNRFQKNYWKTGARMLLRMGLVLARVWRGGSS